MPAPMAIPTAMLSIIDPIATPMAIPMAIQVPIDFVASGVMSNPADASKSSPHRTARTVPGWDALTVTGVVLVLLVLYAGGVSRLPYDFGAYYVAAEDLRAGRSPYEHALAWRAAGHVTGSPDAPPVAGIAYVYPPALALALVPLTALPLPLASAVWLGLLFGCVVGTSWCLATLVTTRRGAEFWLLVAMLTLGIALFKPVRGALTFSKQVDPLVMLLLAGTVLAFVRRRDGWAGVLLGLAITVKPFVVVLALVPLWKGAYRVVVVAGLVSAVLVLGPLLALGLLDDFVATAAHWGGPVMAASPVGQSAYSLLLRTLTVQPYTVPLFDAPWLVTPLLAAIGAGLVGVLLGTVSRSRAQPPLVQLSEFGLAVAAMLVFGPLTEEHHLAYLALGLTASLAAGLSRWSGSAAARRVTVVAAALVLFLMLPGTQAVAWGFYAYRDGPIAPPLAFATFLFLPAMLGAAVVNVAALRLLRRDTSPEQGNGRSR